jgi:hypothetical protein
LQRPPTCRPPLGCLNEAAHGPPKDRTRGKEQEKDQDAPQQKVVEQPPATAKSPEQVRADTPDVASYQHEADALIQAYNASVEQERGDRGR